MLSRLGWVSRTVSISSHLCMASLLPCLLPCGSKYKRINQESNFTYLRSLCSSFNRFWFLIISSSSSLSSSSSAAFGSKLGSLSISCSSESPLLTAAVYGLDGSMDAVPRRCAYYSKDIAPSFPRAALGKCFTLYFNFSNSS